MKRITLAIAMLGAAIYTTAYAESKTPLMDKVAKTCVDTISTGKPQPVTMTDAEAMKLASNFKAFYAKAGINLTDTQAAVIAGGLAVLRSEGVDISKAKKDEAKPVSKSPANLPQYDYKAYCKHMSETVDGGASMEAMCRRQEERAMEALSAMTVDAKTMRHCDQMTRTVDGAYDMLRMCIHQEQKAMQELK